MFVTVGPGQSSSVTADFQADTTGDAHDAANYTNPQVIGTPNTSSASGPHFNQEADAPFSATGTAALNGGNPVQGVYIELLNTTTGNSAFVIIYGTTAELQKYNTNVASMLASMD